MDDQAHTSADLKQLADALKRRGHDTTLITPAPYLAIHIPGATHPQIIYHSGGQFWSHTAQAIAPTGQNSLAAEVIAWALRAHPHDDPATHDATTPPATHNSPQHPATSSRSGQKC